MSRVTTALAVSLALGVSLSAPRFARAQACDPRVMCSGGPFVFAGGDRERTAIRTSIDQATAPMNFIVRAIARARLRDRSPVDDRITVRCPTGTIDITVPQRPVFHSSETGAPSPWRGPDGDTYHLTQRFSGPAIVQEVGTADGSRRNEYAPSADGHSLTLNVHITSPHLPRPVQYSLTYHR